MFVVPFLQARTKRRERMLRLALVVLLVVATASARHGHVKKTRRGADDDRSSSTDCYLDNHPLTTCYIGRSSSEYPTVSSLGQAASPEEAKRLLKRAGVLENLCSEGKKYLTCVRDALKSASAECRQEYASQDLTTEANQKLLRFADLVCTAANIQTIRENVDCLINEQLYQTVALCRYQNPNHDCSHLTNSLNNSPAQQQQLIDCYEEKFRENCNAASVVQCASNAVSSTCTREAGNLVSQAGNVFFEGFPICPAGPRATSKSLLNFFKK